MVRTGVTLMLRVVLVTIAVVGAVVVVLALTGVLGLGGDSDPDTSASPSAVGDPTDVAGLTDDTEDADGAAPGTAPRLGFAATGLAGGGFQNTVSFAADGSSVLVGGDNAGMHLSRDGGTTWLPVGAELPEWSRKVASIAHHPDDPSVVLAAGGFAGRVGGVVGSRDGGLTWRVLSEDVAFSGANTPNTPGLPRTHPRATGTLLLWVDDVLVAGTFDDGVHRSTDGGVSWELLGLRGTFVRGLAAAPGGGVLVATIGEGLQHLTDVAGSATVTPVGGGPEDVEEVAVHGTDVLVAAGEDGAWHLDATDGVAGGRWERVVRPDAVVTTVTATAAHWWVGTHRPQASGGDRDPGLLRSTDRGASWDHVATGDGLSTEVEGAPGLAWWVAAAQSSFLPDGAGWTAAQIAVDPADPQRVLVAGRAGVWASGDAGDSWRPAVVGLGVTAHDATAVAADGRIATANTDHRLLVSDDRLVTVAAVEPGATKGTAVAADPTGPPGTLLVATAERDGNRDGELYRVEAGGSATTSLRLSAATGGRRVLAVAAGQDEAGAAVVVAAVEESGLWRLVDGDWTLVEQGAFGGSQPSAHGAMTWRAGSTVVHALDPSRGLYVSPDAGLTWQLVRAASGATDRTDPTGFLAVDPTDGAVTWASTSAGLWRVDGPVTTDVGLERAGPVVVTADGVVLTVTRDRVGVLPMLVALCPDVGTDGDADAAYRRVDVAVGARFRGGARDAVDLDLDGDDHLVLTTTTNGLLRSTAPVSAASLCGADGDAGA